MSRNHGKRSFIFLAGAVRFQNKVPPSVDIRRNQRIDPQNHLGVGDSPCQPTHLQPLYLNERSQLPKILTGSKHNSHQFLGIGRQHRPPLHLLLMVLRSQAADAAKCPLKPVRKLLQLNERAGREQKVDRLVPLKLQLLPRQGRERKEAALQRQAERDWRPQ